MPSRRTVAFLLALLLAVPLALPAPAGAADTFTRTILGDANAWDGSEVVNDGLNNLGHAAAYAPGPPAGPPWAPFFWSREGGLVPIPLPPESSGGYAVRINDADEVTGNSSIVGRTYTNRAFWWSPATGSREVVVDPAWGTLALALNRFGTVALVAGEGRESLWGTSIPYLWHPDNGATPLAPLLGEPYGWPLAINDAGQVVGGTFTDPPAGPTIPLSHPFRYTPGRPVERPGAAAGTPYGTAHGINRGGDAIVTLQYLPSGGNPNYELKAVLWGADGSVTNVAPPGGRWEEVRYLNDRGEVCGRYTVDLPGGGYATRAFYWSRETGPIDIGAAFPGDSDADGMNALGHVAGFYLAVPGEWASLQGYFWSRETGVVELGPGRAWAINDADTLGGYANGPEAYSQQAAVWTRDAAPPPACTIPVLLAKVDALEAAGTLKKGNATSLRAKLRGALAQGAVGKGKTAANLLFAFANEVKALVKAGRLPAADGEALTGCSSGLCTAFRAAGNGTAAKAVGRK